MNRAGRKDWAWKSEPMFDAPTWRMKGTTGLHWEYVDRHGVIVGTVLQHQRSQDITYHAYGGEWDPSKEDRENKKDWTAFRTVEGARKLVERYVRVGEPIGEHPF